MIRGRPHPVVVRTGHTDWQDVTVSEELAVRPRRYAGRLGQVNYEPTTRLFALAAPPTNALISAFSRHKWVCPEHLPASRPVIVTPNHLSQFDPLIIGQFLVYNGRWPHYLARANLFDRPVLGHLLRGIDQIPVDRGSIHAADSLRSARQMLDRGLAVVIYPEGGVTRDPEEWPMAGHLGAARLALATGVPILPVGQWGANFVLPSFHRRPPQFIPRVTCTVRCGEPLDLMSYGAPDDRAALQAATVAIMDAITAQVEAIRGLPAPEGRWHPRHKQRVARSAAII